MIRLESMMTAEQFWIRSYGQHDNKEEIPVKHYPNLYFIKWLIGVAYGKLASRSHLEMLRRMLTHPFWTVRNAAVERIVEFGTIIDIPWLIEDALSSKGEPEALLRTLTGLDERLYPLSLR